MKQIGQRNRGKKQLRIDEARKLGDLSASPTNAGDDAAVGVLTALLLGLRASEVTDRVVRDLDDDGRLLWIEFGKTKRSRRAPPCSGRICCHPQADQAGQASRPAVDLPLGRHVLRRGRGAAGLHA